MSENISDVNNLNLFIKIIIFKILFYKKIECI